MNTLLDHREKLAKAAASSPLAAGVPIILGACKGQTAETIETFIRRGLADFGENRVQEAGAKWPEIKQRHPHLRLHLIGPLQTNKVREALALFDVIQTLDRAKLVEAIAKELKQIDGEASRPSEPSASEASRHVSGSMPRSGRKQFYVQVNTGEEPQKAGISPTETTALVELCRRLGLNIVGLMCVPPADQMPAPHFALLRKLAYENGLKGLSMGMSEDCETAVRMGSTCVRIGRALFGQRPAP